MAAPEVPVCLIALALWTLVGSACGTLQGAHDLATLTELRDYCETELFQPRCGHDEVIVMATARYGRMHMGRCVKKNMGYMGCFTNVRDILDKRCSGRTTCEVRIPDPALDESKPCVEELKTYLQAQYHCVSVMQPPFTCTNNKQWVITQSSGYIANSVAMDTSCGSPSSPLTIQVQEGQRINLTLYNFDRLTSSSRDFSDADTDCDAYAHVIDKMADRTIPVCRGGAREKHIVISSNRSVDIVLYTTKSDGFPHGPILVYFEAIGCPNFKPPEGMWVKRTEDDAQVGCDVTREVGTLLCIDGKWRGDIYNCSKLSRDEHKHVPKGLSHGVSVVIIVTIAIGIGVVVLLCGIVVIKRMKKPPHREVHLHPTRCNDEAEELEQLKVNYDNELRKTTCHANEPELLQHVLYDKSKKDGGCLPPGGITTGYSPLHTCMHDAAHVQLRAPEVLWKATSLARNAATTCDYDVTGGAGGVKTLNSTSGGGPGGSTAAPSGSHPHKDNVAMVQPCTMTTFSTNPDKGDGEAVVTTTCTLPSNSTTGPPPNNEGGPPSNNTLNPPGGRQSLRSFHDSVYSDRPACVHAQAVRGDSQRQAARNPRNIYEPKRTRVLYTLNNSF